MHKEIERKFLVYQDQLPVLPDPTVLMQAYINDLDPTIRIRTMVHQNSNSFYHSPDSAKMTFKGPGKVERVEIEFDIPLNEARAVIELWGKTKIFKNRYKITYNGHLWEVDQFLGNHEGLWLAEIELDRVDQEFDYPPWLSKEVTDDPRYTNVMLARNGIQPGML